uniref:Uncharacterized protein n=1 Tax=Oryza meridionalis TaxID=40149 RepID=A0A0E0DCC1_9ORYZ
MPKWDRHCMSNWFYHTIPFEATSDAAKTMKWRHRAIAPVRKPKVAIDGTMKARFALLRKIALRLSCRDLVEEFSLTLPQAESEARKMIGELTINEYSKLLTRQTGGRANRVFFGELPVRANPIKVVIIDDDAESSKKHKRAKGKSAPCKHKPIASTDSDADDEEEAVDESFAAGTSASVEGVVKAASTAFAPPPFLAPHLSPLNPSIGKQAITETSGSDNSLSAPRFVSSDFETRVELIPFVKGVGHLVSPVPGLVPFTELNKFDEGCTAAKSLLVRALLAQCSIEKMARIRLDGYKSRLRSLEGELSRRDLEKEALTGLLKEANIEIKKLRLELEMEKKETQGLVDYYNESEGKMKAHRQELELEKSAAKVAMDEAKTACHTLRLALTDLRARASEVPARDASALAFMEWT